MAQRLLAVLVYLALTHAGLGFTQGQASIGTDRGDYSPGDTVYISGAGFEPGEAVELQILQIKPADNEGAEHQPWRVEADGQGRVEARWPVTAHEAGATLQLRARGLDSGVRAQKMFTDSAISEATGGSAIGAGTAGGSYTALSGPAITETVVSDIGVGTIVLAAPPGFEFDTNPPLPFVTLSGDNNSKNINGLKDGAIIPLTVTTEGIGFTVTTKSRGQTRNTLTYSGIRVRPTAATPLASGDITNAGTALIPGGTNFGTLVEVAGPAAQLAVSGFPTPQTAGVPGSVTVTVQDEFGNAAPAFEGRLHFTSSDGQAVLPADYTFVSADNGVHTFEGIALKTAGIHSLSVTDLLDASFGAAQGGIVITPAAAARLVFTTQPGSATYGMPLSPQPALVSQDEFGNNSSVGLAGSEVASLTLSSGAGQLGGTLALDIGTGAGNGAASFSGLVVTAAGAGKQLTASAAGLSSAVSSSFTIFPAPLTAQVTVSNKVYDASTSAAIGTRALAGVINGDDVRLVGGTATFATKTSGAGKAAGVSGLGLSGTAAGNYVLTSGALNTTADILPAPLTVTAVAADKVYDGTRAASVTLSDNRVGGDSLTASYTTATFADKQVGTGKPVNVSGISISGPDAANYTASGTAMSAASITPASLIGTANNQVRLYGENNGAFSVTWQGFVPGEDASLLTGVLSFSCAADSSSPAGQYSITASGQSAPNYSVQYVGGSLSIVPAPLLVAAENAARAYGEANPKFSASISGFVNGEGRGVLGGTLALKTTAGTGSLPGDYPIVPSGLESSNYAITYSSATLTITSTNQAPAVDAISDAIIRPEQLLAFTLAAADPEGDRLSYSLDPGAPAGAVITSVVRRFPQPATNTVFRWRPTRAQASTTNLITVRATDDGAPPMSSAQSFRVVVLDYVEIRIGCTNVQSDDTVVVPIGLASSEGVTNLGFSLQWPSQYLTNPTLTAAAGVGSASLQEQGNDLVLTVEAAPGQVLEGTQQVAVLSFSARSNPPSAFVPLPLHDASAAKPDGSLYVNYITPKPVVAVVVDRPLLRALLSTDCARSLALYGRLGVNYQLEYSTDLAQPDGWTLGWSYTQTNGVMTIAVDSLPPDIFYRIYQP